MMNLYIFIYNIPSLQTSLKLGLLKRKDSKDRSNTDVSVILLSINFMNTN